MKSSSTSSTRMRRMVGSAGKEKTVKGSGREVESLKHAAQASETMPLFKRPRPRLVNHLGKMGTVG